MIILLPQPNILASSEDDWSMFRHDPAHTGATTGSAPMKPLMLWSYAEGHFDGSFIGSSAAVINGTVYVGSNYNQVEQRGGNIYALDAYTGAKIWNYTTNGGVYSSPTVSGSMLFIGVEDNVCAFDASTGFGIWNYTTGGQINSSPDVVNGVVYIGSWDSNVYALNASTGKQIWEDSLFRILSSAAVSDDVVYVAGYAYVYALNTTTGSQIWNLTTQNQINSSPAIFNGVVYIGSQDGNFYAIGEPSQAGLPISAQTLLIIVSVFVIFVVVVIAVLKYRKNRKITLY